MANIFDNIREGAPSEFVAGDYVAWKETQLLIDYPASTYSVSCVARSTDGACEISATASAQDDHWLISLASSATSDLDVGEYRWQLEVVRTSDSARVVVKNGAWDVVADLDRAGIEIRTHAEIMVTKLQSLLEGKPDSDVMSYSIAGRSITKLGYDELIKSLDYFRARANEEKAKRNAKLGKRGATTIQVRF